jgi:tetratricopeptide (TPR) repeat protein
MVNNDRVTSQADERASLEDMAQGQTHLVQVLAGSKVRISVSAGILAALIVAIGFLAFDLGRERFRLKQRYPNAANSHEREVVYARDLVSQGQCEKAIPLLRRLIEKEQGSILHADALLLLGTCLERLERDLSAQAEARELYERFVREYPVDPRVPKVNLEIARNYARSGLYIEANSRYDDLLRQQTVEKKRAEIEFLIARNYYDAGNFQAASERLEQVRQKYAETDISRDASVLLGQAYFQVGQTAEAERVLRTLIGEVPGTAHAAAALRALAHHALEAGAFQKAVEYSVEWLRESPQTAHQVDVMLIVGRAKLALGEPSEAEAAASDIISFFPDSPQLAQAYVLRGQALEALELNEDAENAYRYAANIASDDSRALRQLASLYSVQGKLAEAIAQMKLACQRAPQDDSLFIELAKLYRSYGENVNAVEILKEFTEERGLSPYIGEAHLLLSETQLELGLPHDAYKTLGHLLAVETSTVAPSAPLLRQGDILASVGLYEDAIERYREALELGGKSEDIAPRLAHALLTAGKPEESLKLLESLEFGSFPLASRFALFEAQARAFSSLGRYQDARRSLREAIALRSGKEKISTLALLMQADLQLKDERAASKVYEAALRIIETEQSESSPEARRIILDWGRYLYEKGAYAQAARVYGSVRAPQFPADDVAWAVYQIGNCRYHLADFEGAQQAYARLRSEFSSSEWVKYAEQRQKLMSLMAPT